MEGRDAHLGHVWDGEGFRSELVQRNVLRLLPRKGSFDHSGENSSSAKRADKHDKERNENVKHEVRARGKNQRQQHDREKNVHAAPGELLYVHDGNCVETPRFFPRRDA
jgi:hypothetical protein